jgi:hypothetical protein
LAVGEVAVKIERLKREFPEFARERLFFFDGQNARMITEPLRQTRGRGEQVGLNSG